MDRKSLDSFSKAAYSCLKDERLERPDLIEIVGQLEKALSLQVPYENFRKKMEDLKSRLSHFKIKLADIMFATNYFSGSFKMWDTDFYELYKAKLKHFDHKVNPSGVDVKNNGGPRKRLTTVVIKRILPREDKRGEEVFCTEIEMLTTCKHPNIANLLGFCDEDFEMIVVVEHFSKGYLDDYLDKTRGTRIFTWEKRLKICIDVARGLNYLHRGMEDQKMIINRNICRSNIGLDVNCGAKITDFGLSIFLPPNQEDDALRLKIILGLPCYIDPEYKRTYKLKRESDVYSFGVMLLEIICGNEVDNPIYTNENYKGGLVFVARRCLNEGTLEDMIDRMIKEESSDNNSILAEGPNKDSLDTYGKIAYWCLAETQDQRPTMKVVVKELEKALVFQEKEQVQRPSMNQLQVVDQFEKSMQHNLTHENHKFIEQSRNAVGSASGNHRKGNNLEYMNIPLSDIMLATDNFSKEYTIRKTKSYELYRVELEQFTSILPKRHNTVIIKRILPTEDEEGDNIFSTEIEMLTTCNHPNIIGLLGICDEGFERILVIENISNGYLHDYFIRIKDRHILTWAQRLKICVDVAHALCYLHYEMKDEKTIINRAICSSNIVLNENWGAKILDFGFSVFLPPNLDDDALDLHTILGYMYYLDPEYEDTCKLKRESDVYSFGVVLLEIFCGRLAKDRIYLKESDGGLASVARRSFHNGKLRQMIDPIIKKEIGENNFTLNRGPNENSLDVFLNIACECLKKTQDQRPTMKVVIKELEKALLFQENDKDSNLRISLEDIKSATQNFHDENCVGRGGFGKVYKGKFPQGVDEIVAKLLDTRGGQGEQQFRNELQILFDYKHENIVSLVGYCDEEKAKIIVYAYAPRGSLDRYLSDATLNWMRRLKICIDVATALDFLHRGVGTQETVIHRDIKTENILLTGDWNAKLADFGLSLRSAINLNTDYVIDRACGTQGYVDPLYLYSGFLTKESDIYSFGVVLFEILCGKSKFAIHEREGVYLPSYIKRNFEEGRHGEVVFVAIKEQIMPKALTAFQTIAYKCLHEHREERPNAKEVVEQLKNTMKLQRVGQKTEKKLPGDGSRDLQQSTIS